MKTKAVIVLTFLAVTVFALAGDRPAPPSELPDSASELIQKLKSSDAGFTVINYRVGYVKDSDVPYLVGLLDSQEPCGYVTLAFSSVYFPGKSTVGHEAAYLIEGFWKRYYPTQLTSQQYKPDFKDIKQWYETWSRLKKLAEPSGAANGSQPFRPETNSTSSAAGSRR